MIFDLLKQFFFKSQDFKLDYFELKLIWFFLGIFGKVYDDAIDMYFIKHGSLFLEFIKILIVGMGLLILLGTPDSYTPLLLFCPFIGAINDYDAFLKDKYWCSISICALSYASLYLIFNFRSLYIYDVIKTIIFFHIPALPFIPTNLTFNGPLIDYLNLEWLLKHFDKSEISLSKFILRTITIFWCLFLILFLNKRLFNLSGIKNPVLLHVFDSFTYFVMGYVIPSVINMFYNLYIDKIYERKKEEKKKKERKRRKKRELKRESREKNISNMIFNLLFKN